MKPLLFNYLCAQCNNRFKYPGFPDSVYGEFILISESGEIAYLNSFEDKIFDEVRLLFKKYEKNFEKIDKYNEAKIFQEIFSITCDQSPSGGTYRIDGSPICPVCKSTKMVSWGETNPPEIAAEDIIPITHKCWNELSLMERESRTENAIKEAIEGELSC